MDLTKKIRKLLEEFKNFNEGDLKEKIKHQKKLEKLAKFDPEKYIGDDIQLSIKMNQNADAYINALNFIEDGGIKTFESEIVTSAKSERLAIFIEYQESFSDEDYWQKLAETYTEQDFMELPYFLYKGLFSSSRGKKELLMNDAENIFLEQLPEMITIYRGGAAKESETEYGVSWTLNKIIAEQFVDRKIRSSKDEMIVHKLIISKSKVIAYFNSRKEEEIIYLGK